MQQSASNKTEDSQPEETSEYSRRTFIETAAAASATAAVAGCFGDEDDSGPDQTSEQDFVWWTMRGYIPAETEAIEQTASGFEDHADENINLQTEVVTWDQVFQEWSASLEGRTMPNVSEMACEHAVDFGYRGAAEPNTELFEEHDDWYPATGAWGQFDGEKWGQPWFIELRTSHVNMDLINEAGYNDPPETWEEIVEIGQAVTEETDASGWGTPGATDFVTGHNLTAFLHQSDGALYEYEDDEWSVEIDSAASLFAHLWTLSLREEWDIAPGGWGGVDGTGLEELYREERIAVVHNATDLARSLIDPQDGVLDDHPELAEATELTPMPAGPNGERRSFMGGSCLTSFTDEVAQHDAGTDLSMDFISYMQAPDTIDEYFPVSQPNFLPVREGQEEAELFADNPTELPDSWMETRLEQVSNAVRYGVSGANRSAPFLGSIEGETTAYSTPLSGMIGDEQDPKEALLDVGNMMRSEINDADYIDYELPAREEEPSLDDAPDSVQPWIEGDGVPQIYNPYE